MPASPIVERDALRAIRGRVAAESGIQADLITGEALQAYLECKERRFNWDMVAAELGVTRRQIKRWYFETYQRHTHEKVTRQDAKLMQQLIEEALRDGVDIHSRQTQDALHARLSTTYHRQAFYTAYTNAKRLVLERQAGSGRGSSCAQDSFDAPEKPEESIMPYLVQLLANL